MHTYFGRVGARHAAQALASAPGFGLYGALIGCSLLGAASAEQQQQSEPVSSRPQPSGLADQPAGQTNHPLDYEAVVNENTANMTLAKKAAMEAYQAGRYKEAEKRFLEAIREAELGFGTSDPHVAACRNNLAELYRNTKQYGKAEELYRQALQQLEELYGEKHWLYVAALHNLALLHDARGSYAEAEATFRKVMALRLAMFGPRHYLYADTMFALAHTLQKVGGRSKEVLDLMRRSVAVLEESGNVEATAILYWLMELCKELRDSGQHREAADYLQKAIEYLAKDKGEVPAQGSEFADMLVVALEKQGRLSEATAWQQKCVQSRLAMFGHHPVVARSACKLARMEAASGQAQGRDAALRWASMAMQICDDLWKRSQGRSVRAWFDSAARAARCQERVLAGIEFAKTVQLLHQVQDGLLPVPAAPISGSNASSTASSKASGWFGWGSRGSNTSDCSAGQGGSIHGGSSGGGSSSASSSSSSSSSSSVSGDTGLGDGRLSEVKAVQASPVPAWTPVQLQQLLQLAVARLDECVSIARQEASLSRDLDKAAELTGHLVDARLALVDALDALAGHLRRHGGQAALPEVALLEARSEQVATDLMAMASK